ncbi:MAG TPA: sigma-70 family RNA polymerase sigma factor [Gammaproteobacteria bacterium]|nr:sigma-70 family RNA polymerase sigma factor [Gammaproteobacteria bacterium]
MPENDPYAELLLLCSQGDEKAFARLYQLTSPKLFGVCLRLMKTSHAAEDVLQEGYIKIWKNAGSFNPAKASAMTWMATVVRNRGLDVLRSQRSRPQEVETEYEGIDFSSTEMSPGDLAGISWSARRVNDCMQELKEKQRESILMAYYYGHTHEEIAAHLAAPLGTVKAWVRRGVERLRKCLE